MAREEAQKAAAPILWEGADERVFNGVMAALDDAGIAYVSELRAGPDQIGSVLLALTLRTFFWKFGLFKNYAARQRGWRIKVLQTDYSRAEELLRDSQVNPDSEIS
jgi:hypothetical protein